MPELLTKHPDIVLSILKDAKIKCDIETKPRILMNCPKQNFCSLPTGELCIYGVKDISKMSQIQPADVFLSSAIIFPFLSIAMLILLLGIMIGIKIK